MLVRDWMSRDPQTVSPATPVMEAMQQLRQESYRRLPVVLGGKLVGIVTDRDLKEATPSKATSLSMFELNYLLSKLTIREVMRAPVITIAPDEPIEQAALLMETHRISGLVVIDGGAVIGMLTITDLLRAFVTFLGLREGGRRLTIDIPDTPGELALVAQAAPPANMVAVVSAGPTAGDLRRFVVRVKGEGADTFADRLRAQGIVVRDVR